MFRFLILNKLLSLKPLMAMSVFGYSEPTSGRYLPSNPRSGLEEVEYYQSEAEGLLECHKCKYLCTGRGEPFGRHLTIYVC